MINRWDEAEAAALDGLGQLVYQSRLIGAESSLVVWGGGNTSLKIEETDFRGRATRVLRVKGSGSDLKSAEREHFTGVRLDDVLALRTLDAMTDEAMVSFLAHALIDPDAARPSIETLLHAFVPAVSVVHTHADAIVSLTNNTNAVRVLRECFGDEAAVVAYVRPGFTLSKAIADTVAAHRTARCVVMSNHGLLTWGWTAREAYDTHVEMVTRAEEYLARCALGRRGFAAPKVRAADAGTRREIAVALAPALRGAIAKSAHAPGADAAVRPAVILQFDDSDDVLDFVSAPGAQRLSQVGPATPDHLMHTKRLPLFLEVPDPGDIAASQDVIRQQVAAWADAYRAYFARNSDGAQVPLDAMPRVALLPGIGMWGAGTDARRARMACDVYHHTMSVMGSSGRAGEYTSITEKDAFDVEYWPLELYKLTLAPPEKELARRVALITGATGAIGGAIAERLAQEGAHVVITDVDEDQCRSAADAICACFGAGVAVGVVMDVTSEESVRQAFASAALAFGGLDVVVSNAGIAHSARIDELALDQWQRSINVNATGHFLVAREAVRMFRQQGTGGNIVFNVTKNALAAGAEFGAYSAAKAAELQLARVLAVENGRFGVRVNAVNPDAVFSARLWSPELKAARAQAQGIAPDDLEEHYRQRNLLGARIAPEDVAEAVFWLASDHSRRTTGAIIPVDGGLREAFPR